MRQLPQSSVQSAEKRKKAIKTSKGQKEIKRKEAFFNEVERGSEPRKAQKKIAESLKAEERKIIYKDLSEGSFLLKKELLYNNAQSDVNTKSLC